MNCEIIAVGTELLLGDIVNTNAQFLSQKLSSLGLDVYHQVVVGDNLVRLIEAIKLASSRADMIITTGGLGPTDDDITKLGLSNALGVKMMLDENSLERIKQRFSRYGKSMPIINERQAYIPIGSKAIDNDNGTAPGIIGEYENKVYIALPGPPREMIPMFQEKIIPYIKQKSKYIIKSHTLKVIGMGESDIHEYLGDIIVKQSNPTIALYAKDGEVQIRITAKTEDEGYADKIIRAIENQIHDILDMNIYGSDEDTLESVVNGLLQENKKTIAFAESCTGGLISSRFTDIPNASLSYINGVVCYSNDAKIKMLGVKKETLNNYGAVSPETAEEMALGIKKVSGTDIGVSITGIAGPSGGSVEKPVGLCFIGIAIDDIVRTYSFIFNGNRSRIKLQASTKALDIIRRTVLGISIQ